MRFKPHAQDIASGIIILTLAVVGWYLNQDHAIGTARRMGPGYMPMLTFWILGGLGLAVLIGGFSGGPEEITRKSWLEVGATVAGFAVLVILLKVFSGRWLGFSWYAVGLWTVLAVAAARYLDSGMLMVLVSMAVFAFTLERLGFVVSIVATTAVASLAERTWHPARAAYLSLGLLAMTWGIFIKFLDIRIPVFPWSY